MRRRWRWIALGVVLMAVIGVGGIYLLLRDTATPIVPEEVAATFSGEVGRSGGPGLYVFDTTGFEEVDALGGTVHDYADDSVLTISVGGCGWRVRWQPLEERWDELEVCDDLTLAGFTTFHRFFGRPEQIRFECDGGTLAPPGDANEWEFACTADDDPQTTEVHSFRLVGMEEIEVGGDLVETVHLELVVESSGRTVGTETTELWMLPGTPLPVRHTSEVETVTDSGIVGKVTYTESFLLQLRTVEPQAAR